MRSENEVKLLKIRQQILKTLEKVKAGNLVDFDLYLKCKVKLEVCNELIILARKHALKEATSSIRGIKCEQP
jgi:hypothetical protein